VKLLVQGSPMGMMPHYISATRGAHAPTLRELLDLLGDQARAIDPVGLRQYFDRHPDGERTCFQEAKLLPAGSDLYCDGENLRCHGRRLPLPQGSLLSLLEHALQESLICADKVAVALSGGLDSALVFALTRRVTGKAVPVVTLATRLPGYCELEQTLENARLLGIDSVEVIEANEADLISALPDAIAGCETPLFNLHPVSKLLLAREVSHRGYDALLTGDGADQVFAASDPRNYLPIVGAIVRATGLTLLSPFLDERVVGWAKCHGTDPEKTALRQAAAALLPAELVWCKKTPRLAPDFDLTGYRDHQLESQLAPRLGLPLPNSQPGPQQTLWATTAMLARHLGGTC